MIVHEAIQKQKPELVSSIKQLAIDVGLDLVDYSRPYLIVKVGSKTELKYRYTTTDICLGMPSLVGDKKQVALMITGTSSWFKTSGIIKVEDKIDGIYFETLNSFYKLIAHEKPKVVQSKSEMRRQAILKEIKKD